MNYEQIPSPEIISHTRDNFEKHNIKTHLAENSAEALELIKKLIPASSTIMNGSSRTLDQIGFIDILKNKSHNWQNLHDAILEEQDPVKREELRKQSLFCDYFLVSTHAITENGELVNASASGSQLPSIIFTAKNVIFVASTSKIVPNLEQAVKRIETYVYPLEDARMKSTGAPGSVIAKILIFKEEPLFTQRQIHLILINEKLGF